MKPFTLAVLDVLVFPIILIGLLGIGCALALGYLVSWVTGGFDK